MQSLEMECALGEMDCCCSIANSCPTLCDPVDCSTPGLPVLHYLPEFSQTHVHWVVMPYDHLILCRPLLLLPSIFPSIRDFIVSWLFASGGQSIEASVLASVLPMNIQGWFPLKWTGLISLLSKLYWRWFTNINVLFDFWVVHKQRYWEEIIITVIFL